MPDKAPSLLSSVRGRLSLSLLVALVASGVATGIAVISFSNAHTAISSMIDVRLGATTSAHRLAQQSEAIAATTPSLVSAQSLSAQSTISDRVSDQIKHLQELASDLSESGADPALLQAISSNAAMLSRNFRELEDLVQHRIELEGRSQAQLLRLGRAEEAWFNAFVAWRADLLDGAVDRDRLLLAVELGQTTAQMIGLLRVAGQTRSSKVLYDLKMDYEASLAYGRELFEDPDLGEAAELRRAFGEIAFLGEDGAGMFSLREMYLRAASASEVMLMAYNQNAARLVFAAAALAEGERSGIVSATDDLTGSLRRGSALLIGVAAFGSVIVIGVGFFIGRGIVRRLEVLQHSMDVHASGGEAAIPEGGRDEIARMSAALKKFLAIIRERETQLKSAKDDLELRVQERTQELVTEIRYRKEAEEEMIRERDRAEAANRAKSEFLAMVSHELRTPLNAIIGYSEVMRDEILGPLGTPRYSEYANDINHSGLHLLGIINDILDVARIENGHFELVEERVDIADLVQTALRLIRPRAEEKRLRVQWRMEQSPILAYCDQRRMKQVLLNLLSNAAKFTDDGGSITVTVSVRKDGDGFSMAVSDTGIGMSRNDIEKALQPFGQVDSRLSRKYDGTGLGLPLVKFMIERHGGAMIVESEVGAGTTVTILMPASRLLQAGRATSNTPGNPGSREQGAPVV